MYYFFLFWTVFHYGSSQNQPRQLPFPVKELKGHLGSETEITVNLSVEGVIMVILPFLHDNYDNATDLWVDHILQVVDH